jgi:hypothetical protein
MLHDTHFQYNLRHDAELKPTLHSLAKSALVDLGKRKSQPAIIVGLLLEQFLDLLEEDEIEIQWGAVFDGLYTQSLFVCHYEHGPKSKRPAMSRRIQDMCYLNYKYSQSPKKNER